MSAPDETMSSPPASRFATTTVGSGTQRSSRRSIFGRPRKYWSNVAADSPGDLHRAVGVDPPVTILDRRSLLRDVSDNTPPGVEHRQVGVKHVVALIPRARRAALPGATVGHDRDRLGLHTHHQRF